MFKASVAKLQQEQQQAEQELAKVTESAVSEMQAYEAHLIARGELVSFSESIAPIFAQRCLACHNARTAKGRYNMETFAAVMKGGESGQAVDPGDGELSTLTIMIEDGSMPKDADPLSAEEIALVKKWIDTGAKLNAGVAADAPLIAVMPKLPQPEPPSAYRVPVPITAVRFSTDGKLVASSGYHEVTLWNPADGSLVRRITNLAERIYDIEFSPDGQLMAVAAGTPAQIGEIKLFNMKDGSLVADLVRTADSVFAVAFSPDGKRLASAGADRSIRVFDVASQEELVLIEDHADWVMEVAWSPDGKLLASASRDKTSKVFNAETGDSQVTFNSHGQPVFGVGFSSDGKQVVTAGSDKQIRVWNAADAKQVRAIGGFGNEVFRIVVTPDNKILSCSADKTARLHEVASGKELKRFNGHTDWVYTVAFHPASKQVVTGSYDGEVRIWSAEDAANKQTFVAAPGYQPASAAAN